MNPLDNEEFSKLLQTIKQDMPLHSETTAKIKCPYSQGMPKNLMGYSTKINNEFLNNNLAIIEEINYRNSKHWIPKWFAEYQKRIYGDSDILNHDGFFKAHIHDSFFNFGYDHNGLPKNTRYYRPMSIQNVGFLGVPKLLLGAELKTNNGGGTIAGIGPSTLLIMSLGNGVNGATYNQAAANGNDTVGNVRIGVYDTKVSDVFSNLQGETGSFAKTSTLSYQSMGSFEGTGVELWLAINSSSSGDWKKADTLRYYPSQVFGAMPASTTAYGANTDSVNAPEAGIKGV